MKIAFIRGPFLNPWELQTYEPLALKNTFYAVGGDWQFYTHPIQIPNIPIVHCPVWGSRFAAASTSLANTYNRSLSWAFGQSFGFYNLLPYVQDAEILHSAELHFTMTYQTLKIREQLKAKLVITVWENLLHMGEMHPLRRARKREIIKRCDGFLAVTETSRTMLIQEGVPESRIAVIPMAVDLQRFYPRDKDTTLAAQLEINPGAFVILFIGRLEVEKGIEDILAAIPAVIAYIPSAQFVFVGAGPLKHVLEKAHSRWTKNVIVRSFVSYEQIPMLHNLADIFILPSRPMPKWQEQFGYVLAESMACGKAIITTRSGSIPDVIGDSGVLIHPGQPIELSEQIIRLARDDNARTELGLLARSRANSYFNPQINSSRIESFYKKTLLS